MQFDFRNIDEDDFADIIVSVERSFHIKFETEELSEMSFGEFCDLIIQKLNAEKRGDCTSQQAFYKLREAIVSVTSLDKEAIYPEKQLSEIFPLRNRRKNIQAVEQKVTFKLHLLDAPEWLQTILLIALLVSIIAFFFDSKIALTGFLTSITLINLSSRFGKTLTQQTIREVAENMAAFKYMDSRSSEKTYNKAEIEKVITRICIAHAGIFEHEITRETTFV